MSFDEENVFITADKLETDNSVEINVSSDKVEVIDEKQVPVENGASVPVNVEIENLPDYQMLNPELPMSIKMGIATNVANCLKDLIEKQGLVKRGLNKKEPDKPYVLVEGWEILGNILGIKPVTRIIDEMKNKNGRTIGFRARATLYRNPIIEKGEIVGGELLAEAEAYATKDGFQKEYFSMASMAQTRALGKAYRMHLSWVMKMAGYEPTPVEEMPDFK